jgi:hypothetical protein
VSWQQVFGEVYQTRWDNRCPTSTKSAGNL